MSRVGVFGQISEISEHLYLSGAGVLRPEKIKQKKITMIVNATTEEPNGYIQGVDYMKLRIEDHPYAKLNEYFDQVADRIKATKERGGRTLVHCMAGVSRSASLVMIYLVKYERMTLRQAYHYVKSARPIIRPNVGFWKQMVDYEKRLRGVATVTMLMTPQCDLPIPDVYIDDIRRLQQQAEREKPVTTTTSITSRHTAPLSTPTLASTKRRGYSATNLRPTSYVSTTTRRANSPSLPSSSFGLTQSYSIFSPPSTRKPRDSSLFSIYSTTTPRRFFSAF